MGLDSILLTGLVGAVCGGITSTEANQQREGCNAAIEASARQSGIYEVIRKQERKIEKDAKQYVKTNFSPTMIEAVATSALVTRMIMGERTSIKLGRGPWRESYWVEIRGSDFRIGIGAEF